MRTYEQYVEDLKKMKPNIYIGEEKVGRDDPRIQGGMNIVKETFERAHDPEYEDLCTASAIKRFQVYVKEDADFRKLSEQVIEETFKGLPLRNAPFPCSAVKISFLKGS